MIRTDLGVSQQNEIKATEPVANSAAKAVSQQSSETANGQLQAFHVSTGTPSRAGEMSAGTNMLKAQMLKATSAVQNNSIALTNGQLSTVNPSSGDPGGLHTIYINGINGDPTGTTAESGILANATGKSIDHVFQQSTIGTVALQEAVTLAARSALFGIFGGLGATVAKSRADLVQKLQNPAAAATASAQILSQLGGPTSTNQVHLIGYSQGAAISAEALKGAYQQLTNQFGKSTADQMMSRVHVLTLGGAAQRSDFPSTVKLTEVYHQHDPVSQFFGDNKTSLIADIPNGKNILKPHEYMNDPAVLSVINRWQNGQIDNTNVQLTDPKM